MNRVVLLLLCLCGCSVVLAATPNDSSRSDVGPQTGPQAFRLGAGDVVGITVYEHPDLSLRTRVSGDGEINFPLLGKLDVNGFDERTVENKVAAWLSARNLVRDPQVSVLIESHVSYQVAVLGQVRRPGKHSLDYGVSIFDVIAAAGGLTVDAHDRIRVLKKGNPEDVSYVYLSGVAVEDGNTAGTIEPGDVVFVPRMDVFYVYGEVERPGSYRLERNMTVVQALSVAGSISDTGTDRGIQIWRSSADGAARERKVGLNDRIQPGDVVHVRERIF